MIVVAQACLKLALDVSTFDSLNSQQSLKQSSIQMLPLGKMYPILNTFQISNMLK